jgi:proteic killer suppression protein
MILNFRHRGLRRLYGDDDRRGVHPEHVEKIRRVLARLDRAAKADDMALPGLRLHPLKGDLAGFWSVTIRANWRIIFRFEGRNVADVDLIDYH